MSAEWPEKSNRPAENGFRGSLADRGQISPHPRFGGYTRGWACDRWKVAERSFDVGVFSTNLSRCARVGQMDLHESHSSSGHDNRSGGGSAVTPLLQSLEQPLNQGAGPTDEELIGRVRTGGDASAFESLVHRYERELFSYLRRYLGSAEMAEDVFQATFLQVHLKRENFEEGRRFRPWLYTIATNQAIDAQRRNRRHRMVSLDHRTGGDNDVGSLVEMLSGRDQTADQKLEDEEAKNWVRSAVEELPDPLKSALILVYHQGMKYREAADVLGIPVGTVKSRLHAALLKLNESWQESGRGR